MIAANKAMHWNDKKRVGFACKFSHRPVTSDVLSLHNGYSTIMRLMSITLNLDDDQSERLKARASELGVDVRELAVAAVNDLLCRQDDDFDRAANSVLEKNRELYRRLG
jgi:hypothetical protein